MQAALSIRKQVAPLLSKKEGRNILKGRTKKITQIEIMGYEKNVLPFAQKAHTMAKILRLESRFRHIPQQKRRFNVLKSGFKWKRHSAHYEKRSYRFLLTIESDELVSDRFIGCVKKIMYPGIALKIRHFNFEPLDKYYIHPYMNRVDIGEPEVAKEDKDNFSKLKDTIRSVD
eukprot:TRINITY_DN13361_c0_g1_i1.p1 TRINITY_DN13361_c0_g1~~TRINITY_DN13361_c0_g1_i1.p1  ORF type:complete len:173 (-),score=43.04 TRINITY_DN13361_c0_g1_i1:53-571(-)